MKAKTKKRCQVGSSDLLSGIELIRLERFRQMKEEGWTPEHDDGHKLGEMALAASAYATNDSSGWPWEWSWWKPGRSKIRRLVKAGALIAAEIDRLRRADTHNRIKRQAA